MWPVLLEFD
jgi:hypothetical protein